MKAKITKKITFSKLLKDYPEAAETLLKEGMHCLGCPMAQQETLEQGALMHGLDVNKIIEKINKKIKNEK